MISGYYVELATSACLSSACQELWHHLSQSLVLGVLFATVSVGSNGSPVLRSALLLSLSSLKN